MGASALIAPVVPPPMVGTITDAKVPIIEVYIASIIHLSLARILVQVQIVLLWCDETLELEGLAQETT